MPRPTWTRVLTDARKFGAALVGAVAIAVAQGVVPEKYAPWAAVILALGTAVGVYKAENVPTEP